MIYFLLNSSSENTFVIIETSFTPDPETFLKTMQVFKEVIACSALCSSIPPSFPISPTLPETHLSVLTSLHSHLHNTISKMEAIQQQTLSHLQQELREIKTCMMSLPWKSFNILSQIIPSYIQSPDLELPTTSSSSPPFIEEAPSPFLPFSPLVSSSSSFESLTSIFDETTSSDIDNDTIEQALTKPILEKTIASPTDHSSCKRKTPSPNPPFENKKPSKITKTAPTFSSFSFTETFIEKNLPPASPLPQRPSIKLLSLGIDNIVASDDENVSLSTHSDQHSLTQKEKPFTTASPLPSDDVTQSLTPPISTKPSTSSIHRSSCKRKVLSKSSDCYTKRKKITITSSSFTKTLIEENLPLLSPIPQKSPVTLLDLSMDDIVASDDEEYSTSTTSATLIPEQKQSPIKDEKLPTSTKKQKITTFIEKSATHIKEDFLPIIQAPSHINKNYFVALIFIKKDNLLTITYRKNISSTYNFLIFLKQTRQGIPTCVHYKCARYIPEIPQQQSSNTLDLLQALYASIVRNHYFFVKNHGTLSTTIQQEMASLLNLLNQKYYAALQEKNSAFLEEADNYSHHPDLQTFTKTSPQPILNKFNFAWYMLKKQSNSQSLWIIHTLISFDEFQQLRSISRNAKNILKHVEEAKQETSLWINCNDGSVKLPHFPKHSITSYEGFQIFQAIIAHNRKCFNEHIALLEREISDIFWKESSFYKTTVNILDKIDKCLREWKDSLQLPHSNIPLPETADTRTSIYGETIQEINSPSPNQDSSFVQTDPIFIKIVPNASFNSFTIRPCKRPTVNNFKASCKIVKDLVNSSSYTCQEVISEDIPLFSKNPIVITKTLFTALCISAFGYRQKIASSKTMSALTPDLIHSLFNTLKALDQKYCQVSDNPYDPSTEIYHPDLQSIITRGNILSLIATEPATYSFTYTFLSISFKNLHFSTLKRTYSHSHSRQLLQLVYDQLCYPLRDIIKLILSSEVSTLKATFSEPSSIELLRAEGITSSERFTRYETLILCRKMLEELQTQILTNALFGEKLDICNNIKNSLSITLTWLNAHIAHQPLPITPLPSYLFSLPITVIHISKETHHIYHISHPKLWFQEKNSRLESLKTSAEKTYKWLSYLFNHSLQSKEKIIYQNQIFLDFSPLIPTIYRTLEYETLQIKKIILIAIQRSLSCLSIQKSLKTSFQILLKCQSLIETKWQELHPNTLIPTLEELPENIKFLLPFTLQDVELLKKDPIFLESQINLIETFICSNDDEKHSAPLASDQYPQTPDIKPLPTIQQQPSLRTVSPFLSDNAAQTLTSATFEKPLTSSLHKSSRKRKVLSKSSDSYTKKAKITIASSSVTQTLIKENLPPLLPILPRSSIELFTESTDDIVASDDEEYAIPTTAAIPILGKKQSSIKDEKLPTSTKKQKITTSIEESTTNIKEVFLPIIHAPSPTNTNYFVALMFLKKDNSVTITYRKNISSIYNFLIFLKQCRQGIPTCFHYKCARCIPEIPQQESSNKLDLLKALYASIVRNHYFFVKNHGSLSTNTQQEVDSLLNLLNHKYYAALQEEIPDFLDEADDGAHHLDLKTFTETPPQPILNKFNFAWYMLKKQSNSKSLWITHTLISFDPSQQLRSILRHARNMLNLIQEVRWEISLLITCNDGSVSLPHLPKHSLTSHQGFQILQAIIAHNRKCFNEHITLLEKDIPDTFWKKGPFYKKIIKTLDETDKCLCAWTDSLKLQYSNISLPETAPTMTSTSIEATQENNSQLSSQNTSFVQTNPIFIKIVPNIAFNSFTIRICKRPIVNNFKSSCKIAKDLINSSSYLCQEVISEDIPLFSNNPIVITKTLFTALCISAFGYRQKTASSKAMSALTPDLIHPLFHTLKILDQKYCQISNHPYDPSLEIYHPDLQTIMTQGNIMSLIETQPATYSFTYTFLAISLKKQHFSTLEKTYNHSHSLSLLKLIYDQLCFPLKDIIKLILSPEISTLTGTISEPSFLDLLYAEGITSSERFTRHETLILCRKMLEKLQTQVLTDALFKETSEICNNIKNNLRVTLTWLNTHIAHQPLPTTPLPSSLYSLPITVIHISKEVFHTYHISHPKLWLQEKSSRLESLKTCAKMTHKWVAYLLNHPLQSKEKIIYQGQTFLDFSSLVPVIYRTMEYEILQVKKIILIALQRSLSYPLIQKPSRNGLRFLLKCQNLIETKWKELHPDTPIPSLEDLPEDIKPLIPFTLQDIELLKKDPIFLESGINPMEIFKDNDDSDQEEDPLSGDITPTTSSK